MRYSPAHISKSSSHADFWATHINGYIKSLPFPHKIATGLEIHVYITCNCNVRYSSVKVIDHEIYRMKCLPAATVSSLLLEESASSVDRLSSDICSSADLIGWNGDSYFSSF